MRPSLLPLDADVTLQLFIARAAHSILTPIRKRYGIQAIIVPEVEVEVVSHRRLGPTVGPLLGKARTNGLIKLLDAKSYGDLLRGNSDLEAAGVPHGDIQALGRRYNYRVDRGEAYTHATGLLLEQPVASNDMSALRSLDMAGEALPAPVLRTFDLVFFANQIAAMTDDECDEVRKLLLAAGEYLPKAFEHSSFANGLKDFVPRLLDSKLPCRAGGRFHAKPPAFAEPLAVAPLEP